MAKRKEDKHAKQAESEHLFKNVAIGWYERWKKSNTERHAGYHHS